MSNMIWTPARLMDFLKHEAEKLGRTPTMREIAAAGGPVATTVFRARFGSYRHACKLAGLEPNASAPPKRRLTPAKAQAITEAKRAYWQNLERSA